MNRRKSIKLWNLPNYRNSRRASSQSTGSKNHFGTRTPRYTSAPTTPASASTESLVSLVSSSEHELEHAQITIPSIDGIKNKVRHALRREVRLARKKRELSYFPTENKDNKVKVKTRSRSATHYESKAIRLPKAAANNGGGTDDFVASPKEKPNPTSQVVVNRGREPLRRRATTDNAGVQSQSTTDIQQSACVNSDVSVDDLAKQIVTEIVINDCGEHKDL